MNKSKAELINEIKEAFAEITSGKKDRPVFLKRMMISNPDRKKYGWTNYFFLHSIFYGNDDTLFGDLLTISRKADRDILFGKEIEGLGTEDLLDILRALKNKNCRMEPNDTDIFMPLPENRSLLSRIFRKNNRNVSC